MDTIVFLMNFEYIIANNRKLCNVQMFGLFTLNTLTMGNASYVLHAVSYKKYQLLLSKTIKKAMDVIKKMLSMCFYTTCLNNEKPLSVFKKFFGNERSVCLI